MNKLILKLISLSCIFALVLSVTPVSLLQNVSKVYAAETSVEEGDIHESTQNIQIHRSCSLKDREQGYVQCPMDVKCYE